MPGKRENRFREEIVEAVKGLKSAGVDVVAYGMNSPETDRRAPYDFFCVYRVPNVEFQREFERQIAASGWYDYFEQVNVSGDAKDFEAELLGNAGWLDRLRPDALGDSALDPVQRRRGSTRNKKAQSCQTTQR